MAKKKLDLKLEELKAKLYRLKDIEELLGVTNRTLLTYVHNGRLKAAKIGGQWIVTEKNLEAFLNGD